MATAIGFYAGEGSTPRELATNKELVVIDVPMYTAPTVVRENIAEAFVKQRFPTDTPAMEDYVDDIVIVAVIGDEGGVYTEDEYSELFTD